VTTEERHPIDELLAEHKRMRSTLLAMASEVKRLIHGQMLRMEFWADVVDFVGNFVHLVHRRKEEQVFFPTLIALGLITENADAARVKEDHRRAETLTFELVDGIDEGDWEKVVRIAEMYIALISSHLELEERQYLQPLRDKIPEDALAELRKKMEAVEKPALGERNRQYYVDVMRRLCRMTGVETVDLA
jgi:hemerythrin-like domain-containing protein